MLAASTVIAAWHAPILTSAHGLHVTGLTDRTAALARERVGWDGRLCTRPTQGPGPTKFSFWALRQEKRAPSKEPEGLGPIPEGPGPSFQLRCSKPASENLTGKSPQCPVTQSAPLPAGAFITAPWDCCFSSLGAILPLASSCLPPLDRGTM